MGRIRSLFLLSIVSAIILTPLHAQWVRQTSGIPGDIIDVAMIDSTTAIAAGSRGAILRTTDAGATWINLAAPRSAISFWNAVSFWDSLHGILAGDRGEALMTTDGGATWRGSLVAEGVNCLSALCLWPGHALIGTDSGTVCTTVDSGRTWKSEKISEAPIRSLFAYRGPTILGLPVYALTPKTLCTTMIFPFLPWEENSLPAFQGLGSEAFRGEFCNGGGPGFLVGVFGDLWSAPAIVRRAMGDTVWTPVALVPGGLGPLFGVSAPSSNVIYSCGWRGTMFKSTDGGDSWTLCTVPTEQNLRAVSFFNERRGFAVGDSGTILFTANGGSAGGNMPPSAFHLALPVDRDTMPVMRSIRFSWQRAEDPDGDAVRYTVLISSDRGATWESHGPVTDTSLQVQSPAQNPGLYFWLVTATDGELASTSLEVFRFDIVDITHAPEEIASGSFSLSQNYPNPFNPATAISYQLSAASEVNLKVYDLLGREVASLAEGYRSAGSHTVQFDAAGFPTGVYICRLVAGTFTAHRKMLLMK